MHRQRLSSRVSVRHRGGAIVVAFALAAPLVLFLGHPAAAAPVQVHEDQIVLPILGASGDGLGTSLAIDGDTIVAGAPGNDDAGSAAGAAYVYQRNGTGVWQLQARLVPSDGGSGDEFGTSVAVDGDTAVVGAAEDGPGSAYVFTRSGTAWHQQAKLVADDGGSGDFFGVSVALQGDTVLVGAMFDDDVANLAGSAYVFTRSGTTWSQQAKLLASDGVASDLFGRAVALDADTALIGAENNDEMGGGNSGAAYVFTRDGKTWSQQAKLTASDVGIVDRFGHSVAVEGDTILIGSHLHGALGSASGAAYVFTRTGTDWTERVKLLASDGDSNDQFGASVALDGERAVIGASGDEALGTSSGSAYVFAGAGASWSQQVKLTASDGGPHDAFGAATALDGDRVVFGVPNHDRTFTNEGTVYLLERNGSNWTETTQLVRGDGYTSDAFGGSVAIHGDTAIVAAVGDDRWGRDSGAAYVFLRAGDSWALQAKLSASDGGSRGLLGVSVALHEDTAVVGAYRGGETRPPSGAAYVFTRSGTAWTEQARLTLDDDGVDDLFGLAVAVHDDTLVVGAPGENHNGPAAGAAYVFTRSGATWSQEARLTAPDGTTGDAFGSALTVHGDTIAIGAPADDPHGALSGSAYVFSRSGTEWSHQQKLTAGEPATGARFGTAVALGEHTVVVGANADAATPETSGSAYVFTRSGTTWGQQAELVPGDATPGDRFGTSVALDGDKAVVGAPGHAGPGAGAGSAYLFARSGTTWNEQATLTASDGSEHDRLGSAVGVSGASVLVGAEGADHQGPGSGATYAYELGQPEAQGGTSGAHHKPQQGAADRANAWLERASAVAHAGLVAPALDRARA